MPPLWAFVAKSGALVAFGPAVWMQGYDPRMYSLREPLPADVIAHASGPFAGYRRFPVFSVPWLVGRSLIFVPLTGALGLVQGGLIGLELHDSALGWQTAAVCIPIWLVIGSGGPVLATLARHRLPMPRLTVTAALLLGVAASGYGQQLADLYSRTAIMPRYMAILPGFDPSKLPHPSTLLLCLVWGMRLLIFALLGGAPALIAFHREQNWWQITVHARALATVNQAKKESDLRLMVLQAQVEPHFLFNTLASVHSLIRQDPPRAEATLEALVDHLRVTLPKLRGDVGNEHSTLAEQLEVCRSYLTVMQVRMGERFSFMIDVPLPLQQHPFPPLLLISLVENAIKHGIERTKGAGQIEVQAVIESRAAAPQLAVSVIDSGAGLRTSAAAGMGLNNIRDQLIARFGPRGSLTLLDRSVGGVIATLRVPYEAAA
jgi:hypothetical protein